jgi:transposase
VVAAKAYDAGESTAAELAKVCGIAASTVCGWAELCRKRGEKGLAEMRGTPRAPQPDPVREKPAPEILQAE